MSSTPFALRLDWARSLFDHGDFSAAANALRELVDESATAEHLHGTADLRLLLARAYFGSAQLGRAETELRTLVDEAPDDGYLHLLLGRTLQRRGRHDDARRHLALAEVLGDHERPVAYGAPVTA
ncbi:Tetratricopeptide repeat-containing protein [Pedococcus dokdonensis]|uniref:Tetratricopeptide repeat-containing protein n=1 Tax=Pedococcus dokdonensis TaxID=443156 RepID=A0A1H0TTE7_9MICO|nr:tetratricopeptide repeat protein [Pedococcus dokdonensis]SDP57131.1 Tetratricopeptide repeat-containing protein [Pedococcus dokdonensis]